MRWIKKNITTLLLILILLAGLSLLLYPTVADYWNSFHQSRAISHYVEAVSDMNEGIYEQMWEEAVLYNEKLHEESNRWFIDEEGEEEYNSVLNINNTGVMGYIEIPVIGVSLPIYHGVEEDTLQVAIGHIPGSSLPVGGVGNHCVVSGHRGLPSAKLFTDLDKLVEGDIFLMRILNETLTYEVDQILIVEPEDTSALEFAEGKDYCTLVTCTPYGINSHRILVRGHRIENLEESQEIRVTADAQQIDSRLVAPFVALPPLVLMFFWMMIGGRRKRR